MGLSDEELLRRLGGLYSRAYVAGVQAAKALISGDYPGVAGLMKAERERNVKRGEDALEAIHVPYSYRMHSLSELFKGMLHRFTCWFNRQNGRKGTLWESRFRSVIVEDGLAADGERRRFFGKFASASAQCSVFSLGWGAWVGNRTEVRAP